MDRHDPSHAHGLTLPEILLGIVAVGILAGIGAIALNPDEQLGDTRNAERRVEATAILEAVTQYRTDNDGAVPDDVSTTYAEICRTNASTCGNLADLSVLTEHGTYLIEIPVSPNASTTNGTGYAIRKAEDGRISVKALGAERGTSIEVEE